MYAIGQTEFQVHSHNYHSCQTMIPKQMCRDQTAQKEAIN